MNLPTVTLKPARHKNVEVVQVHFAKDEKLMNLIRTDKSLRWSKTMCCWYVPARQNLRQEMFQLLKGKAWLDYEALNTPIAGQSENKENPVVPVKAVVDLKNLSEDATKSVEEFRKWLCSKRYSNNTIATYTDAIKTFLRYYSHRPIGEITNDDLITFNNEYILANKFSASFQNQVVNAVKLFFSIIESKKLNPELVHRPKRAKLLPNVLSKEEIKLILRAPTNLKHKAMLSLIYSCGLRRCELLNLRLTDVDSARGLIIIRHAKGRKDRIAPLSEKTLALLRDYFAAYKPKQWLFEGQDKSEKYDERSLASVLKQALEKSRINKPVSLHWLRHSYATHLLENGTDLRYIQEILGHKSSRTTEIYTHVSTKSIQKIVSPFDSL